MLISCHNCATSYQVEPASLGVAGRSVRCVRCGQVWFAANTAALSAIAQAHRAEIAETSDAIADAAVGAPPSAAASADEALPEGAAATERIAAAPEPTTGEPMADAAEPAAPASDESAKTVTEEPVAVVDAPGLVPQDHPAGTAAEGTAPAPEDIESVAARRARRQARQRSRWRMRGATTTILALIAANLALIGWRADVVRALPQTASLYAAIGLPVNLRGLAFTNLVTETDAQDGVPVLVVDGMIVNVATRVAEVPRLRFSVRNERGHEVYTWTALPSKALLAPGETLAFRSRLASPPRDGKEVLVRFFNRRDLATGIQ